MRFRSFLQKQKKAILLFGILAVLLSGVFLIGRPEPVYAVDAITDALAAAANSVERAIKKVILTILDGAVNTLGKFLTLVIDWLRAVAGYDGYRTQEQVGDGWRIARDVVNSFYIVVLIAIALATIIRWKPLDFRTALRPLLLSAIIVNFSRTICLFAISFSDVIMRTFLDQIASAWPVFLLGLRAPALMALNQASLGGLVQSNLDAPTIDFSSLVLSQIFAVFILGFSLFLMTAFLFILLFRIVVFWVLIILSPVAFFLWGVELPQAKQYYNEWKTEFTKQLLVGPVFGFFLYIIVLFFAANAQTFVGGDSQAPALQVPGPYGIEYSPTIGGQRALPSLLSDPTVFLGYIVGVALMLVTLEVVNRLGGRGVSQAFGITKKGFNFAKKAAGSIRGYANDYLYSKGLSVKPSLALQALKQGTAAKRAALVQTGQQLRADKVKKYESEGKGLRAALAAVSGGNAEFVKSTGLIAGESSLAKRFGRALIPTGARQTNERLEKEAAGLDNRELARKTVENISSDVVKGGKLSTLRQDRIGLEEKLGQFEATNAQHDQLAAVRSQLAATQSEMDGLDPSNPENEEQYNKLTETFGQLRADEATIAAGVQGTSRVSNEDIATIQAQVSDYKSAEEAFLDDKGEIKGGFEDLGANASVGTAYQKLQGSKQKDDQRLKSVDGTLRQRSKDIAVGQAGIRFDMRAEGKKYRDTAYEKDEKYSVDYIANNARSNANPQNKPQFMEDMIKAADQGAFDNVMGELTGGEGHFGDDDGIEAMLKYFQDEAGPALSKQEALDLMSRVEGRNRADKKAVQTGAVKLGKRGSFERTTQGERKNIIKRNVKSSLREVLTKGGRDAIGYKKDGKYIMHEAVKEALQEELGAFQKIVQDDRASTQFDTDTRKMLLEEAKGLGLDEQTLGILQDLDIAKT